MGKQLATEAFLPQKKFRWGTICVEGNIGCGKTTFLNYFRTRLQEAGELNSQVIAEPVEKWRDVEGENLFHYLYKDPARYSLAFQTYVQLTMMKLHMAQPKLMERSIYSARYCFVENLYKLNYLSRLEYVILDKWFKHLVLDGREDKGTLNGDTIDYKMLSNPTGVNIDLIIYLRCSPQKVMDRVRARSRTEEKDISFDYLKSLHDLHESWLIEKKSPVPAPVLVLDTNCAQESLETLYDRAAPYILGEKQLTKTMPIIVSTGEEQLINGNCRSG